MPSDSFTILFVNQLGETLLPEVRGYGLAGQAMHIEYPNHIEADGVLYQAKQKAPFIETHNGTTYRQFIIQYQGGEPAENSLDYWKREAQIARDEFYGTVPFHYYVAYREKNTTHDIGILLGVQNKGMYIPIEAKNIDGYLAPAEHLGGFTLDKEGLQTSVAYNRPGSESSHRDYETDYTISFKSVDGMDLFDAYHGVMAFSRANGTDYLTVMYSNAFYDQDGNRWEATKRSPQRVLMGMLTENNKTVEYRKSHTNEQNQFIVKNAREAMAVFEDFAAHTVDAKEHSLYLIGTDYNPAYLQVSEVLSTYRLGGYQNELLETFTMDGQTFYVVRIQYIRSWEQHDCSHEWKLAEEITGTCSVNGMTIVACSKCMKRIETIKPATGHQDHNHDSACNACGIQLRVQLGDEIYIDWDTGTLGHGIVKLPFVCADENYLNSGKALLICQQDLDSAYYGRYANGVSADFGSSYLKYFLEDEFLDGLGNANNLASVNHSKVTILKKQEYDHYKQNSINQFPYVDGTFITKSEDSDYVMLSNGERVIADEANAYPIRPVLYLDLSDVEKEKEIGTSGISRRGSSMMRSICSAASAKAIRIKERMLKIWLCSCPSQ